HGITYNIYNVSITFDKFRTNRGRPSSRRNKTIKNDINYAFKSLTVDMLKDLYKVIAPSKSTLINPLNSFKLHDAQFRNFLIVHLMLNYGLRVGELMLLTVNSIKKSLQGKTYSLIIVNTEDEFDNRKRKPNIKNDHSHRVLELQERDYQFLNIYMTQIRTKNPSEILFTSLKAPYSALSYSSISKIF
ncbi:MAG: site-specific integrase, partial [Acinetobacter johnsonii]|nr:site-specific integrase [Acinetobacter johnsonii]